MHMKTPHNKRLRHTFRRETIDQPVHNPLETTVKVET